MATLEPVEKGFKERLVRRSRRAGLALGPDLSAGLAAYYDLLVRWNRKINLTSVTHTDEAIDRLLLEPLLAARHLPASAGALIDIGSGGGSPAIPLKLAAPGLSVRMVEAKTRKSAFLREAVRQLGLTAAVVETSRYEELLSRPELHEAADVMSLRAVRVDSRVLMNLQAFLKVGGRVMLFRSSAGPAEPIVSPPLRWVASHPLIETLQSHLVVMEKGPVGVPPHRD